MLDGNFKYKTQVSMHADEDVHANREVGDKWTDSEGVEWEQMKGYRSKINKLPSVGLGDTCSDCEKLIVKQWDKDVYKWNKRCYYCQINFEVDLKATGKWKEWMIEQEKMRWESIEKEVGVILKEMKKDADQAFDKSVVNAMTNENISQQEQKLKK